MECSSGAHWQQHVGGSWVLSLGDHGATQGLVFLPGCSMYGIWNMDQNLYQTLAEMWVNMTQ